MINYKFIVLFLFLFNLSVSSCSNFDEETENGPQCLKDTSGNGYNISGAVKDGMTGDNLSSSLRLYSSEGMFCDNSTTTTISAFSFSDLSSGNYVIKGSVNGYSDINEKINVDSSYSAQNIYTIKSIYSTNRIAIILSWGDKSSGAPKDIDAYLKSNTGNTINYNNKNDTSGDNFSVWAYLDIDDTDYSGPETISVNTSNKQLKDNLTKICFYANIYSAGTWSNTKAVVQYWKNGLLVEKFYAPSNSSSGYKWWNVFQLDQSLNLSNGSGVSNAEISSC